ncbi:MAG: hypothetical protein EXS05_03965 [Planctomycetaceae bacterium]|nr:hypothetical protein [Planctomycetaceae bacterium]
MVAAAGRARSALGHFRISRNAAAIVLLLAGVSWFFSGRPLHHTDLWGHLSYGRWIAAHGRLPPTEPFLPWARDAAFVDTAWLSQLGAYAVFRVGDLAGLQLLQALLITACCGMLVGAILHRTGRMLPAVVAAVVFLALEWFQFRIIRPQMAGLVCFLGLEWILTTSVSKARGAGPDEFMPGASLESTRKSDLRTAIAVALLFVLWANLHGSFVMGLGLLACRSVGSMIDAALSTRSLRHVSADAAKRQFRGLTVLAACACLVNPYGPRLYAEALSVAGNPNLRDLIEWAPLVFSTWQGRIFLAVAVSIAATTLVAWRQVSVAALLPVIVFGIATAASARMLVWWAPLAAGYLALQWATCRRQLSTRERVVPTRGASMVWSAVAAAGVLAAVVLSPWGRSLRSTRAPELGESVSPQTPVDAVAWLRDHRPSGRMFNPYEWGDYLVWAGPQPPMVFVTSQAHLVPRPVWRDYRSISFGEPGCLDRLDDYGIDTVLVDRSRHHRLAARLSRDARWKFAYGDGVAVVFIRL